MGDTNDSINFPAYLSNIYLIDIPYIGNTKIPRTITKENLTSYLDPFDKNGDCIILFDKIMTIAEGVPKYLLEVYKDKLEDSNDQT